MAERYLTMGQAAELAGYLSVSNLYAAARQGRLKTTKMARSQALVTTAAWLEEYLASVGANRQLRGRRKRWRLADTGLVGG